MKILNFIKLFFKCVDIKKSHYLFITMFFIVCASVSTVSIPITLKKMIDTIALHHANHASILTLMISFSLLLILERLLAEVQFLIYPHWESSLLKNAYTISFSSLFNNTPDYFKNKMYGSITSQIYRATSGLDFLMFDSVFKTLPFFINFIFISTTMLFTLDATITGSVILGAITYLSLIYFFNKKLTHHQTEVRQANNDAQGLTTDLIFSWKDIKLTDSSFYCKNLINQKIDTLLKKTTAFYYRRGLFGFTQSLVVCGIIIFANYYEIMRYLNNTVTIGNIVLVNNYLLLLLRPLEAFSLILRSFTQNYSEFMSLEEMLHSKKESPAADSDRTSQQHINSIHLENFNVDNILKNVNFTLKKGEKIAIIGPSGAGKSILLNTLVGIQPHFSGEIYINNDKKQKINPHVIKNLIAFCSADARLITDTLSNNICLGNPKNANAYISMVDLNKKINTLEQGIHTTISEKSILLSTGELQRIKIARTLALERDFEFYDEAISALDDYTAGEILDHLLSRKNKTIVFIIHNTRFLNKFDKVYSVAQGSLSEVVMQKNRIEQTKQTFQEQEETL